MTVLEKVDAMVAELRKIGTEPIGLEMGRRARRQLGADLRGPDWKPAGPNEVGRQLTEYAGLPVDLADEREGEDYIAVRLQASG